jgi:hypothetical protein
VLFVFRVALFAALFAAPGCRCPGHTGQGPVRPGDAAPGPRASVRQITVQSAALGPQPVVVVLPAGYDPKRSRRYPLLVAFSGRGEAVLEPERGAWGWVRDYGLMRQIRVVEGGRLTADDLLGLVSGGQLARYNRSLARSPYAGMVIACPHTFDLLGAGALRHPAYERFYIDELPRALRRRFNVRRDPAGLGLDGVSLGGLWSLLLGFTRPGEVGQIGALQPAVTPFLDELVALAVRQRGALASRRLGLATSDGDGLRPVVTALSGRLHQAGIKHELTLLTGPHDYVFNRGPGGIHMLLWHDRAFQRLGWD